MPKTLSLISTLIITLSNQGQGYSYYENIPDLVEADLRSEEDLIIVAYSYQCSADAIIGPLIEKSLAQEKLKTRKISISDNNNILKLATLINRPFNYHELFATGNIFHIKNAKLIRIIPNTPNSDIKTQIKHTISLISKTPIKNSPKKPYITDSETIFETIRNKTVESKTHSNNHITFANTYQSSTFKNFRFVESFMSDSYWTNVKIEKGKITNSAILNGTLKNVTFKNIDFSGTDFSGSTFENVSWVNCICPDGEKGDCSKHTDFLKTRLRSYEKEKPTWEKVKI